MSYILYLVGFRLIIIIIILSTHIIVSLQIVQQRMSLQFTLFSWLGDPYININIPVNCSYKVYIYIILLEGIYLMLGFFYKAQN